MKIVWPSHQIDMRTSFKLKQLGVAPYGAAAPFRIPIFLGESLELLAQPHDFLFEKYFYSKSLSPIKTLSTYADCLGGWFKYLERIKVCWKLAGAIDIVEYRNSMRGTAGKNRAKVLNPSTINLRIAIVVEFYKFYWSKEIESKSQESATFENKLRRLNSIKLRLRQSERAPKSLSVDACQKLIENLNGAHKLILRWALATGLRTGSIINLKLADICGLLEFSSCRFMSVIVKGGKYHQVYIPKVLAEETKAYIDIERKLSERRGTQYEQLFLNSRGHPLTSKAYYTAYKRACAQMGVQSHPHQARTTFATFMHRRLSLVGAELGLDKVKIIQGLLGHASSVTTEQYLERIATGNPDVLEMLEEHSNSLRYQHEA